MVSNKTAARRGVKNSILKKKLGNKCVYCGCENKLILTIDHIIPTARGGEDTNENKQVCCFICNQLKGALNHAEFKKYYKALMILKDLNKIKLNIQEPELLFAPHAYPKTLKELKEKELFRPSTLSDL